MVAYPVGSLHDLCVVVVVVLLDEVVRHFRQDLSILLIICHVVTKELVRRSPRLAALPRVEYCATRKSVRCSPRLAKLAQVSYKE